MTENYQPIGRVTIAPQVLTTIVRQTALSTDGVADLANKTPRRSKVQGRRADAPGIEVIVVDGVVHVTLHINATPGANMLKVAEILQSEIAHAIEHIVGLQVATVDVIIDDVTFPQSS